LIEKESEIKRNSYNHFDVELWKNWVEQSASFFAGLLDGSVIGILIGESEDQIILLEKKESKMMVKIENPEDMERHVADIIFKIKEEDTGEILEDYSFIKFIELLSNQNIRVYGLRSQLELIDKGYIEILGRLEITDADSG